MKWLHVQICQELETQVKLSPSGADCIGGHPNILALHDYFTDDENLYVVLELAEKANLSDLAFSGKLECCPELCCHITRQICEAMQFMHKKNVMHRCASSGLVANPATNALQPVSWCAAGAQWHLTVA